MHQLYNLSATVISLHDETLYHIDHERRKQVKKLFNYISSILSRLHPKEATRRLGPNPIEQPATVDLNCAASIAASRKQDTFLEKESC